jgi:hypothetical protein
VLDEAARRQVLTALLVGQRHSWDQGLTAAVLEQPGTAAALRALVDDAVARQLPDGRLGELDPACAVNSAMVGRFVELGRVAGVSAAPHLDRPGHSPEAQAFLLLADSLHRDWQRGKTSPREGLTVRTS